MSGVQRIRLNNVDFTGTLDGENYDLTITKKNVNNDVNLLNDYLDPGATTIDRTKLGLIHAFKYAKTDRALEVSTRKTEINRLDHIMSSIQANFNNVQDMFIDLFGGESADDERTSNFQVVALGSTSSTGSSGSTAIIYAADEFQSPGDASDLVIKAIGGDNRIAFYSGNTTEVATIDSTNGLKIDTISSKTTDSNLILLGNGNGNVEVQDKILIPDGSISAPALTFKNDVDTGIYLPSADTIGFVANGNDIATIDNTGLNIDTISAKDSSEIKLSSNLNINDIATVDSTNGLKIDKISAKNTTDGRIKLLSNIRVNNGTESSPSLLFDNNYMNGFYRFGPSQIGVTIDGSKTVGFHETHIENQVGSTDSPSYSFENDTDTGIYRPSDNTIGFVANGNEKATIDSTGLNIDTISAKDNSEIKLSSVLRVSNGSSSAPSLLFDDNNTNGLYRVGNSQIGVTIKGSKKVGFHEDQIRNQDGSTGDPSYSFENDTDTGIYRPSANTIGFVANGNEKATIDNNGLKVISGDDSNPSISFIGDINTGIYRDSANTIGFATKGIQRATINNTGLKVISGSGSNPSISFIGDTYTGIYYADGNNNVGISSSGDGDIMYVLTLRGISSTSSQSHSWNIGIKNTSNNKNLYFYSGSDNRGYIVDGGNASQMNFTGQHRCVHVDSVVYDNVDQYIGLIVVSTGRYSTFITGDDSSSNVLTGKDGITINDSLPIVDFSDNKNQKNVFGIISNREEEREYNAGNFVSPYEKDENDKRLFINSIGEGAMWVCNINGNFENGDYITTCDVKGFGSKQDDDLLHNYTVAKITMDCDFSLENDNKYICEEFTHTDGQIYKKAFVGCTYHCG